MTSREDQIKALEHDWATNPRWKLVKRGYSAADVVRLRGSVAIDHTLAKRGAEKLWKLVNGEAKKGYVNAFGAITAGQAMQQAKAGLEAVYLSGWQVAADGNTSETMYPDQSLYAYDSVPTMVRRINNTFTRADEIQWSRGIGPNDKGFIDYFLPVVADAEAGFGGVLNAFELMKNMIVSGAAGVHFEDQLAAAKKCGHMGGKVLVPTREAVAKLQILTQNMMERAAKAEAELKERSKAMSQLKSRLVQSQKQALSDALTGLPNRRAFDLQLDEAIEVAHETKQPLSVAFCDIDFFKKVNDTHGHAVGDRVIKHVAQVLKNCAGAKAHVARHGGEEYALLFENMNASLACDLLNSARARLDAKRLVAKDTNVSIGEVTISCGVATLQIGETGASMLSRADQALYDTQIGIRWSAEGTWSGTGDEVSWSTYGRRTCRPMRAAPA